MLKQYKLKDYDFRLVAYVVVLTIIGILVIGSANSSVQGKQILGLVLGLITMVVVSLMDYEFLLRFSWIFYFINIVFLTLVTNQKVLPVGWRSRESAFSRQS